MICKNFISRIYLCLLFVLAGASYLCGMQEYFKAQQAAVVQTSAFTELQPFYNEEDLKLIELTFLKTIDTIFDLKDSRNKSKREINLSTVPPDFHVFYDPDGQIPSITPIDYLKRFKDYFGCSPYCYVIAIMYIERFISRYNIHKNEFHLACFNQFTFYRLYLAALLVASKIYGSDTYCTNEYYAMVGGISTEEINVLERQFLRLMGFWDVKDFTLHVQGDDFNRFVINLQKEKNSLIKKYAELFLDMKLMNVTRK